MSKVSCSRNTNNTEVATNGNQTHNLSIRRPMPRPLIYAGSHTRARAHFIYTCMYAHESHIHMQQFLVTLLSQTPAVEVSSVGNSWTR